MSALRQRQAVLRRRRFFRDASTRVVVHRDVHHAPTDEHRHEFFEIAIVLSGEAVHITGGYQHAIGAGDILMIGHNRAHGYKRTRGLNLVNLLVRETLLDQIGPKLQGLPGYHLLFARAGRGRTYGSHLRLSSDELKQIEPWIDRLEAESRPGVEGGALLAEAYLTLIIGVLCRCWGRDRHATATLPPRDGIGPLLSWIERNLGRPIAVPEMARRIGMSARTFRRRFQSALGVSPARYVLDCRVRRAAEHLRSGSGGARIGEIAWACGFDDANHFSRAFRQRMGKSPREYRVVAHSNRRS